MKAAALLSKQRPVRFVAFALMTFGLAFGGPALANHTVLVEGEADFDGDGQFGDGEDSDGDQVFGSLQAGVNGVGNNGRVMVVTSGRFFEQVVIDPNGIVVLEAAPGVNAIVEAFNAGGDNDANNRRQQQPGIVVIGDGSFPVEIRNIASRNWTEGIRIADSARVSIDDVKVDSNVNYGIRVQGNAAVDIVDSQVNSSGFRQSGTLGATPGDVDPNPGIGIAFENSSTGFVAGTTVAHSFADGISLESGSRNVQLFENVLFNNGGDDGRGNGRDNGRGNDRDNDRDDGRRGQSY